MAVIKSGIMVGNRRSIGGICFQRRKGTQIAKNKPTRAVTYQPSELQIYYQEMYSWFNTAAKSRTIVMQIIQGGWGGLKKNRGASNLNNWLGYMIRLMTRDAGGAKLSIEQVRARFSSMKTDFYSQWFGLGDMTKSQLPIYYGGRRWTNVGNKAFLRLSIGDLQVYYAKVIQMFPKLRTSETFQFVCSYRDRTTGDFSEPAFYTWQGLGGDISVQISTEASKMNTLIFAIAFPIGVPDAGLVVSEYMLSPSIKLEWEGTV